MTSACQRNYVQGKITRTLLKSLSFIRFFARSDLHRKKHEGIVTFFPPCGKESLQTRCWVSVWKKACCSPKSLLESMLCIDTSRTSRRVKIGVAISPVERVVDLSWKWSSAVQCERELFCNRRTMVLLGWMVVPTSVAWWRVLSLCRRCV